jgi:hypothetical protein
MAKRARISFMEKNIGPALKTSRNLSHVKKELIKLFKATRNGNGIKIGYVAGIINSDGPEYFEINREKLVNHAAKLRKLHNFPMFTAVDVFPQEIYKNLEEWTLSFEKREAKVRNFWRKILKSGYVTDIFMTPRWDKSKGATEEHETAKEIGLRIHYIEDTH